MTATRAMTAVVVDDDAEIRDIIGEYLVERGFAVTQAGDGLEALLQVKRTRPDLIVLDLMMPRLGGIDALAHIRKQLPDVAVIVLTGTPDDALRGRVVALGAAALLPKPLDLDLLGMIIGTVTTLGAEPPRPVKAGSPAPPRPFPSSKVRVLVADDEEEIRGVLAEFLQHTNYQPVVAADGLATLQSIIEEPPAVVLLDIQMPRLSGIEALTAIRAIAPATQVIMISGTEDVDLARQALSHGAFDFVKKPLDLSYLERSIQAAITLAV
jgi:CheY-like chemotaxis protein